MISMPTNAVYFSSYAFFKRKLRKGFGDSNVVLLAAGCCAQADTLKIKRSSEVRVITAR